MGIAAAVIQQHSLPVKNGISPLVNKESADQSGAMPVEYTGLVLLGLVLLAVAVVGMAANANSFGDAVAGKLSQLNSGFGW
ncbi:MAG: hypothetical protein AB1566_07180 [Chloroflexota bacterium]